MRVGVAPGMRREGSWIAVLLYFSSLHFGEMSDSLCEKTGTHAWLFFEKWHPECFSWLCHELKCASGQCFEFPVDIGLQLSSPSIPFHGIHLDPLSRVSSSTRAQQMWPLVTVYSENPTIDVVCVEFIKYH